MIAHPDQGLVLYYNALPDAPGGTSTEPGPAPTSPTGTEDGGGDAVRAAALRRCYERLRPDCLRLINPR